MPALVMLLAIGVLLQQPARYSPVQDGHAHGDPPYLLEPGWELHHGLLVQKEVDVDGPTRAHLPIPEAAENPLMLQGHHSPVAYRNIYVRPLRELIVR